MVRFNLEFDPGGAVTPAVAINSHLHLLHHDACLKICTLPPKTLRMRACALHDLGVAATAGHRPASHDRSHILRTGHRGNMMAESWRIMTTLTMQALY